MATLYKSNDTVATATPDNGKKFTLKEMQAFVGGYIEMIRLPDNQIMVVNEEGRLRHLPWNKTASKLAEPSGLLGTDQIVGDVLVGTPREFGFHK